MIELIHEPRWLGAEDELAKIAALIDARYQDQTTCIAEFLKRYRRPRRVSPRRCNRFPAFLHEMTWKASERFGKLTGCPHWSCEAYRIFEEAWRCLGTHRSRHVIAAALGRRVRGPEQLQHEHVFPRNELVALLQAELDRFHTEGWAAERRIACLTALLDRLAIGCVVTREEHDRVMNVAGCAEDPFRRYRELDRPIKVLSR